jgi:hypothetical protein
MFKRQGCKRVEENVARQVISTIVFVVLEAEHLTIALITCYANPQDYRWAGEVTAPLFATGKISDKEGNFSYKIS